MKKYFSNKNIFIGATILALAGVFSRAIGAFYKIPLTNTLGANGMGVYYLIFPFYSLLLVLSSSGISTAVSTLIAKERANNNRKNELIIFRVALIYATILSLIGAALIVVLSDNISLLQGNINAKLGYIAIAPALVFASLISIIRAFFQGLQNMFPTSVSYIIEQLVKIVFGLYFAKLFLQYGVEYSVFGAVLGVSVSELVSLILIGINYLIYKKKNNFAYIDANQPQEIYTYKSTFKLVFKYSLPSTFSALIIPITSVLDSFMVINLLTSSGFTSAVATSLYGINNGIVTSLVNLPIILTTSLSTAIIPNLSGSIVDSNNNDISIKCSMFIKVSFLISLPCMVLLIIYAKDIIYLLYSRGLDGRVINEFAFAYKLLIISSASIIYYGFLQTFTAILQAIGKPISPLISLCIALLVRSGLVAILVRNESINIFGVAISHIVFLTIASLICLIYVKKYVELKFSIYKMLLAPILAVIIMSLVCIVLRDMFIENSNIYVYCIFTAIIGLIVYVGLIFGLKCFNVEEKAMLPKFFKRKKKVV